MLEHNTTEFHNHTVFLDTHRQQLISQVADLEKTVAALTTEVKELVEDYQQNLAPEVTTFTKREAELKASYDTLKKLHERLCTWANTQGRRAGQGGNDVAETNDDDEPSFGRKEDFRPKATGTGFSDQDLIEKIKKHISEKTWLLMLADTTKDNWPKKWTEFLTFALQIFMSLQQEGHHAKAKTKDLNAIKVDAVRKKGKSKPGKARSVQDDKLVCTNCKKNKPTFFKSSKHFSKYCTDCFKLDHVKKQVEKEKEAAMKKKDGKKKDDDKKKSKSSKT
ncbi:uncharacterized protein LAESUDRAFT_761023 [Laetiporus sulphureus 93-53]|uniref:Uncharacterized protein n=1 Tax=Laetiporus sulphureus 93-53 TaxID=1314785 RepID=A0A165DAT9_9APHY|nr:uncharacterized protein LAESUDRAFT_761023 [Laetiporus sulphureus 93-53]KZT04451.1 hypothetical protein LAESUDRAFT_761023 [Laetiporus sulphureus 93-53]